MEDIREYPAYKKALEQLSQIERKIEALEADVDAQQNTRQSIIDRLQDAEAMLTLERVDLGFVDSLQKELHNLPAIDTRILEPQRKAASILRNEMPALKQQAIEALCNGKKKPYCQALNRLAKAVIDAGEAYLEVDRLFSESAQISPTHEMQIATGGKNPDIPAACGLPLIYVDLFATLGGQCERPADKLIRDIEQYTNK